MSHLHAFIRLLPPPLGLDPEKYLFKFIRDSDISHFISQLDKVETYLNEVTGAPEVAFTEVSK